MHAKKLNKCLTSLANIDLYKKNLKSTQYYLYQYSKVVFDALALLGNDLSNARNCMGNCMASHVMSSTM